MLNLTDITVRLGGRIWGALVASAGDGDHLPEDSEERLAAFAELVAQALANADAYEKLAASELRPVADARVPLENAENARIVAWRPTDGGKEHLAIVIGEIDPTAPVLVRLH